MGAMKTLIVLLVLLAIGGSFAYPLAIEDRSSECDSLERLVVRLAIGINQQTAPNPDVVIGQSLQGFSNGQVARAEAREQYPKLPASIACTVLYWRAIVDPNGFRQSIIGRR
jgi:hypothetical protein